MKPIQKIGLLLLGLLAACQKDFLDERADRSLMVPSSKEDFQALLDHYVDVMNWATTGFSVETDEVSIADGGIPSSAMLYFHFYTWQDRQYLPTQVPANWQFAYRQIYYANVVLEGIEKIKDDPAAGALRGSALFFRAWAHVNLLQLYAPPYQGAKADQLVGVPLRLTTNINEKATRPSLETCYQQVLGDLLEAAELLPERSSLINRPSQAAAWALLARIHLIRQNYQAALEASTRALNLQSDLLDFKTVDASKSQPFDDPIVSPHPEIIFYACNMISSVSTNALYRVDSTLFDAYGAGDLRKAIFFNANRNVKASYLGRATRLFGGLATDELYLIRAECEARLDRPTEARTDLLTLLEKRYQAGKLPELSALEGEALTEYILWERRKELYLRGLRWQDLRRLNLEPRYAVSLHRQFEGKSYVLPANDPRYTLLLPDDEVAAYGLAQNPR